VSPDRKRQAVQQVIKELAVSERRACRVIGQPRATQRYEKRILEDELLLTQRIIALASQYGRYGYRQITGMLRNEGWIVNHKRVERIWQKEGLKVPQKQPKRGRLWLNDGSIVRLRASFAKHVWSYDFMEDRTHDGRKYRILNVIDEYSRECLAIKVARRLNHRDVLETLNSLFLQRGLPVHIRSDNGSEFTARKVRYELLNGEIFYSLKEAQVIIEMWRKHYNTVRPHSVLGYRPPAPETIIQTTQVPQFVLT